MLQVAGHLFIIPTYHNKQWQLWLDYSAATRGKNWRGRRQKSQVGKGGLIREAESGQETGAKPKINHCNYIQEHRGGLGQCEWRKIAWELYKLSPCTDDSSNGRAIIMPLLPDTVRSRLLILWIQTVPYVLSCGNEVANVHSKVKKKQNSKLVYWNKMNRFNNFVAS